MSIMKHSKNVHLIFIARHLLISLSSQPIVVTSTVNTVSKKTSRLRIEIDSMPAALDEITRRVMQLEIEEAALNKEKDQASRERLEKLQIELAELRTEADAMTAQWQTEKQSISRVRILNAKLMRCVRK